MVITSVNINFFHLYSVVDKIFFFFEDIQDDNSDSLTLCTEEERSTPSVDLSS